MTEPTPADGAPATPPATPADNAPTPAVDAPKTPEATTVAPEIQALIDEAARKASQDANREAKSLRDRLKTFEADEQKRKDAELSDAERLTKERDEATKAAEAASLTARAAVLRADVATQAAKLNIVDTDAALALLDKSGIEYGDDGTVTGVADALTALVTAKPYLVAASGTPPLDPTNGARTPGNGTPQVSDAERLANLRNPQAGNLWKRH